MEGKDNITDNEKNAPAPDETGQGNEAEAVNTAKEAAEIKVAYCVNVEGPGAVQFCDQLAASVYSIRATMRQGGRVRVFVFYENIPADLVVRILGMQGDGFSVQFARIPDSVAQRLQAFSRHSPAAQARTWSGIVYARIFLPLMLAGCDRAIYLDADTLVRKPLDELWDTDLGGKALAMNMGITPEYGYNSGVMLMDLTRLRKVTDWTKLLAFMQAEAPAFYCPDQTVINRFYAAEIQPLERRFNYAPIAGAHDRAGMQSAVIWHWYCGPTKPQAFGREDVGASHVEWNRILAESQKQN